MSDVLVQAHISDLRKEIAAVRSDLNATTTRVAAGQQDDLRNEVLRVKESYSQLVELSHAQRHLEISQFHEMLEAQERRWAEILEKRFQSTLEKFADQEKRFNGALEVLEEQEMRFQITRKELADLEKRVNGMHPDMQRSKPQHDSTTRKAEQETKMQEAVAAPLEVQPKSKQGLPNVEPVEDNQQDISPNVKRTESAHFQILEDSASTQTYVWAHSVYDAIIFLNIGISDRRHCLDSFLLIFALFGNFLLVVGTVICTASEDFVADPFSHKAGFEHWRNSDAHTAYYLDPVKFQTLASRVCSYDPGIQLSIASQQRATLLQVRRYFDGITWFEIGMGRLMCNVAVALWVLCCTLEFRTTLDFVMALASIPRGRRTKVSSDDDGLFLESMSHVRYASAMLIGVIRGIIAVVLVLTGSTWLTYTTSIEALLLNASALGFVLDIDNTIFSVVAPYRAMALMDHLKPGSITKGRLTIAVPYIMMCIITSLLVAFNLILSDVQQNMNDVQELLCEPTETHNFVIGQNPFGWITYAEAGMNLNQTRQELKDNTVDALIRNPGHGEKLAMKMQNFISLTDVGASSVEQFVNRYECVDYNSLGLNQATVGSRLWASTGDKSFQDVSRCEDLKDYCWETSFVSDQVRFLCSDTCGCSNEFAGLWDLSHAKYGCPFQTCSAKLRTKLDKPGYGCKDLSRTDLKQVGWNLMLRRMRNTSTITEEQKESLSTLGCDGLQYLELRTFLIVCTMDIIAVQNYGAAPFCPVSCRCADSKPIFGTKIKCPGVCPRQCCLKPQ